MSAPDWRSNSQLYSAYTQTSSTIGTYIGDDGGNARVNVGESTITVRYATKYKPIPGDVVVLTFAGGVCRLTGPAATKDRLGKVTAVAYPFVTFTANHGRPYTLPYDVAYSPTVGDTCSIDWDGQFVSGAVTATPVTDELAPTLTVQQVGFTLNFYAKQSGTYDSSQSKWVSNNLYCAFEAAWFYGDTIQQSLKDDAHIDSVEIYLSLRTKDGAQPLIGRHSDLSEQTNGVSTSDAAAYGWDTGWHQLPPEWALDWRTNPGGVTVHGGTSVFRGTLYDRQSGKLRIRGRQ